MEPAMAKNGSKMGFVSQNGSDSFLFLSIPSNGGIFEVVDISQCFVWLLHSAILYDALNLSSNSSGSGCTFNLLCCGLLTYPILLKVDSIIEFQDIHGQVGRKARRSRERSRARGGFPWVCEFPLVL